MTKGGGYVLTLSNIRLAVPMTTLYLNHWVVWLLGAEAESLLVDPPASRRQVVEPEQLPYWHDTSSRRCWGYIRAHLVQRHLLPYLGGFVLVSAHLVYFGCVHITLCLFVPLGRRLVDLRSQWNTRNWLMPSDQVSTKSLIVASPYGGPQPLTEPMWVLYW